MVINIQRIVQDGLDMEKNFLELVELQYAAKLENFNNSAVKNLLEVFYQHEGGLVHLASLLNAVFTQEKVTFYLDYRVMSRIIREDPNIQVKEFSPFIFKMFLEKVTRGGFIRPLGGEDGENLNVYTLLHPDLLKYFYRAMGKEAIAEQRSYVLQYVRGLRDFQHPTEESEDEEKLMTPPLPLEEMTGVENMRSTGIKEKMEQEMSQLRFLQEKARIAESFRLANPDDQPALQAAILSATEARKHEKLVNDLEWKYLKSKDAEQIKKIKAAEKKNERKKENENNEEGRSPDYPPPLPVPLNNSPIAFKE